MGDLLLDDPAPFVRRLTLNRPEARNALSTALLGEIADALDAAAADDTIRTVVITGGPKVFAAGADIKELATRDVPGALLDTRVGHWSRVRRFPKPLLAAVAGFALGGGCELAMHADIVVAGEEAKFGQPEINLGIVPGAGGTQRLARLAGAQIAMKLVLSGEFVDAAEAKQCGLIAEIASDPAVRALDLAVKIAAKPPLAARLAKELVLAARDAPLDVGLAFERKAFAALFATADFKEGVGAFLEKRKPNFAGK
ncbi:MAG: enoyl-CoA hydratase-related protein [Tagaea sp.]